MKNLGIILQLGVPKSKHEGRKKMKTEEKRDALICIPHLNKTGTLNLQNENKNKNKRA